MNANWARILVNSHEDNARSILMDTLSEQGYKVTPCESDDEALNHIQRNPVDVIIADLQSGAATGLVLLQTIKEINPEAAFIAMIESHNSDAAMAALTEGAFAYTTKPINLDELRVIVRNALKHQALLMNHQKLIETIQQSNAELNEEIVERRRVEDELRKALAQIKTLGGLLPICSSCKKVRDDTGYWSQIETYIQENSNAEFTHSLCPHCMKALYSNVQMKTDSEEDIKALFDK